jgi:dipeptidyl aminopeptidase/acylaminoacyl peptidase
MNFARIALRLSVSSLPISTLLLAIGAAGLLPAQSTNTTPPKDARIGALIQMIGRTRTPTETAISPHGTMVAWSVETSEGTQIHLTNVAHPDPAKEKIIGTEAGSSNCSSGDPIWSPNGDSLAFVSTCTAENEKPGQEEIFLWSKKTGQSRQLTHLIGEIESPAWSPDGRTITFLFVENATREAGATAAMKPWSGVIGEDGVEIQKVGAVDVANGSFRQMTPANLHVYEFNWSPDSKQIAYVAANPPGENNWWVAQLYIQAVQSPRMQTLNTLPPGTFAPESIVDTAKLSGSLHNLQIAVPRWSPDGKQIAFIGGLMSDEGSNGGDVYLVPASGGEPKDITPNRAASVAYITWTNPHTIGISEHVGGSSHLSAIDLNTGHNDPSINLTLPESIGSGTSSMSISAARNGDIALIRESFEHAPEVWAGPIDHLKQITHLNDGLKPLWGKSENIEWVNEGFHIQGWLLYPANYDPAKKYPLLVYIHGGPSSAVTPRWPSVGYGDLRDTLAGMDILEKRFSIDKNREGITGWSYGGFMTMFAVTQTTRFKAAVAGAGISNWQSYYGENSIDQWMIPFFGKSVYDDPAVYAKSSAINYIKNAKTPTLIVVGDRDGECPAPQSFEFWHALRAQGIKTQLVVYPDEGHHFANPDHRRDVLERALNWFETEMPYVLVPIP